MIKAFGHGESSKLTSFSLLFLVLSGDADDIVIP
jgi:hypothetical protein